MYWIAVFFARLAERFIRFAIIEGHWPGDFPAYLATTFSCRRFVAISLWILVLFFIYVTVTEFIQLFGRTEMSRLFFTSRPSELQLNRRQRARDFCASAGWRTSIRRTNSAIPAALPIASSSRSSAGWHAPRAAEPRTPAPGTPATPARRQENCNLLGARVNLGNIRGGWPDPGQGASLPRRPQ